MTMAPVFLSIDARKRDNWREAFPDLVAGRLDSPPLGDGVFWVLQPAGCGAAEFLAVGDGAVSQPRYATDAAAAAALIQAAGPELVLAPGTSRFARCLPGVAHRVGAQIDTHIVALCGEGGAVRAQRWFYRQRILGSFSRAARPWMMS